MKRSGRKGKPTVGDIYRFNINEAECGCCQIIHKRDDRAAYYFAVFEPIFQVSCLPEPEVIASGRVIFLANSFDALITHNDWTLVGNVAPDLRNVPFPSYKVSIGGIDNVYIESYDETRKRRATPDEVQFYDFRSNVAPIRLEKAFKAYHKLLPWSDDYTRISFDHVAKRA